MQLYFYNGQPTTYYITTDGRVYNSKTDKWLKGQINKNGYISFNLSMSNLKEKRRLYIHRMIMETYNPVEDMINLEVNHIDGNKQNNNITNLEWVTSQQNKEHAINNNLYKTLKKVYCYNENKELIATYRSILEAFRITNISISVITQAAYSNPKIKAKSYYWSFEELPENFETQKIQSGKSKKVGQYDKETNELIKIYPSLSEAGRQLNCSRTHIGECCNGRIKTYKGFIWKYI